MQSRFHLTAINLAIQ